MNQPKTPTTRLEILQWMLENLQKPVKAVPKNSSICKLAGDLLWADSTPNFVGSFELSNFRGTQPIEINNYRLEMLPENLPKTTTHKISEERKLALINEVRAELWGTDLADASRTAKSICNPLIKYIDEAFELMVSDNKGLCIESNPARSHSMHTCISANANIPHKQASKEEVNPQNLPKRVPFEEVDSYIYHFNGTAVMSDFSDESFLRKENLRKFVRLIVTEALEQMREELKK